MAILIWFAFDLGISEGDLGLGLSVSNQLFWFIQLGFAIAAISIVSGAIAERMKLWAYTAFVVVFCALLYPMVANWVWNPNGWLAQRGFNDFAGSAAVHAMGGFAALAAAIVLGPRLGKYNSDGSINWIEGHNLPLAAVGAFILWFGWFGFNRSSLGAVGNWELIGSVIVNTFLASAAGGISTMIYTQFCLWKNRHHHGNQWSFSWFSFHYCKSCNVVNPVSAILIGLVAGVLVDVAVLIIDK